jgi:ABC-2 type transport system ATP-binding protein
VALAPGAHDAVRDAVLQLDLALLRLEQRRHRLEDIFHAA